MFTTIQDGGRRGFAQWGVPTSGPMDRWSARLANRLVGNRDEAAVIEVTLLGPRLRFDCDCAVAVTGAEFDLQIGSRSTRSPWSGLVAAGTSLTFGPRRSGARAYVGVGGSFRLPRVLGSQSTQVRSPFRGFAGRAMRAGDVIAVGDGSGEVRSVGPGGFDSWWSAAAIGSDRQLRVMATDSTPGAFESLCAASFIVSARSDRMGYRLEGSASWTNVPGALLSAPTTLGAVQLPPGGEPILLMADHQTTGGYAQIAVVCRADRQVAGQLAPGDRIRFVPIVHDAARDAHFEREGALNRLAPEVPA
jgi:biotin-dependent carboxylase-like uncharacterized protein